jgi:hypothetical protein
MWPFYILLIVAIVTVVVVVWDDWRGKRIDSEPDDDDVARAVARSMKDWSVPEDEDAGDDEESEDEDEDDEEGEDDSEDEDGDDEDEDGDDEEEDEDDSDAEDGDDDEDAEEEEALETRLLHLESVSVGDRGRLKVYYLGDYYPLRFGSHLNRGGASGAVLRLKDASDDGVRYFAKMLHQLLSDDDVVIAMPGHQAGAAPASGGLRQLIQELQGPDDLSDLLVRTVDVPSSKMARSSGKARPSKALHAQTLRIIDPRAVRGRTVLLLDDVLTTGATMIAASDVLRAAGVGQVVCLALTRTVKARTA